MYDRLLDYIRGHELMRAGDRVGVAVSGGADSTALLRLLLELREELGVVLAVVHFNHKLRGEESDGDERFVRELAAAHDLEFHVEAAETRAHAALHKCGIEAAARALRYEFFWKLLGAAAEGGRSDKDLEGATRNSREGAGAKKILDRLATGHTMDDQAETVLLRFMRGAGTRGLAGIHPVLQENKRSLDGGGQKRPAFARDDSFENICPTIVRPLLEFRRAQLRHYLRRNAQAWREDASNQDTAYARNKLRQELMPKVREFNAAIEQVLGETADIARAEEDYWREIVSREIVALVAPSSGGGPLSISLSKLLLHPLALQRRLLRDLAARHGLRLEFQHVQQVLNLAGELPTRAEKRIELANDYDAVVVARELRFERRCPNQQERHYESPLSVPGEVEVPAAGLVIAARLLQSREGELLDPDQIGSLRVRNWRAGDRYWPAHTREPKKLKELLQARQVPAQARAHWPVVVSERNGREEIVWVPGFAFPAQLLLTDGNASGLKLEHRVRG